VYPTASRGVPIKEAPFSQNKNPTPKQDITKNKPYTTTPSPNARFRIVHATNR
jgi:hypothetical protein